MWGSSRAGQNAGDEQALGVTGAKVAITLRVICARHAEREGYFIV